jgi:hypothetical protein
MVRLFSSWFAVVFVCACIALGCGGGPSIEAPHGSMGGHSSTGTSASSGGSGTTADGAGSSGTGGSAGSGGAGGAAVVTDLFVDALVGADTNPGTQDKRFKTLTHALSVATSGQTVHLYSGTYDASNGETFPAEVPDGVTIDAVVAGDAVVLGDGSTGLVGMHFMGDGTLRNLRLQGFAQAVKAEAGELTIHGTELRQDGTALLLSGGAIAICEGCTVALGASAFELHDDALLTMKGGEIHDLGPNCSGAFGRTTGASMAVLDGVNAHDIGSSFELSSTSDVTIKNSVIKDVGGGMCGGATFEGDTFDMAGSSSLRIENTTISGGPGWAIMIESGAKLVVTHASISTPDGINVSGDADVTIDGTTLDGSTFSEADSTCVYVGSPGANVALTDTKIDAFETGVQVYRGGAQLRNTTIGHATTGVLFQGGSLDLGSVSEPGGNIWQTNTGTALRVSPSAGAIVPAFGNTWIPNTQGADANGHYSFGVLTGPYGLAAPVPCNFAIADGSKVVR